MTIPWLFEEFHDLFSHDWRISWFFSCNQLKNFTIFPWHCPFLRFFCRDRLTNSEIFSVTDWQNLWLFNILQCSTNFTIFTRDRLAYFSVLFLRQVIEICLFCFFFVRCMKFWNFSTIDWQILFFLPVSDQLIFPAIDWWISQIFLVDDWQFL